MRIRSHAGWLANFRKLVRSGAVAGPRANELQRLVEQIAARVGQVLERRGLIDSRPRFGAAADTLAMTTAGAWLSSVYSTVSSRPAGFGVRHAPIFR